MKGFTALTGTLAALLLTGIASAAPKMPDSSFETSTAATPVPDQPTGSLTVYACRTCAPALVRLTPQSEFRVGKRLVSFQQFREHIQARGPLSLAVIYDARQGSVTLLAVPSKS